MSLRLHALLGFKSGRRTGDRALPVSVPLSVVYQPAPCTWVMDGGKLRHVEETGILVELPCRDGWNLREEFLAIDNPDSLLAFLNGSGVFSHEGESSGHWRVDDLFTLQRVLRYLLTVHPTRWRLTPKVYRDIFNDDQRILGLLVRNAAHKLEFSWTADSHSAAILTRSTIETLLATVQIDHIRGARFDFCARPDCGRQYEIVSKHRRKYCSYDCAHKEAVRSNRRRRAAKSA